MTRIDVSEAKAVVRRYDVLTVGRVGAQVEFTFDRSWYKLSKTAVFRQGDVTKDVVGIDDVVSIPPEVLQVAGLEVEIGVYGTNSDGTVVIPTVWARTKPVEYGADPSGDESTDPALPVWAQMLVHIDEVKETCTKLAVAVNGTMSGDIVAAKDVSPIEHELTVKARGKNLFNTTDDFAKTGEAVYTYEDGVLTITGGYAVKFVKIEEGKTYTFSSVSERLGNTGGGIYLRLYTEDKAAYRVVKYNSGTLSPVCTFTTEKGDAYLRIVFYGSTKSDPEDTSIYSNIQLEEGAEATEYVPYIDPADAVVFRSGTNLVEYPFSYVARTINDVAFTPREDGTLFVKGTATANTYFALNGGFSADAKPIPASLKPGKEYTVTDAMVFLYTADGETTAFKEGTFTMPEGYDYYGIFVYVASGTTMETLLMPQLELGASATEFEEYTCDSYKADADGSVVGVSSLSPGVTLYAEADGIYLDVEYNRDTNVVIQELYEADAEAWAAILALADETTELEEMIQVLQEHDETTDGTIAALQAKLNAAKGTTIVRDVELLASAWTGEGSLYSQVVEIDGVTESSQVNLAPNVEQMVIFYEKDITFVTENDGGVITVYVIGQKPTNDYTIQADIVEVSE